MEVLDIILPFPIHECWFRIICQDLITFDTILLKDEVTTKVITSYKLNGESYNELHDKKNKVLNRIKKYQLQTKEDFWGNCEQIFFSGNEKLDTAEEIRAALKYNFEVYYYGYINRYKQWECEAYNSYYPKYCESNRFNYLWEEDFILSSGEIEKFLVTYTKMYLDMAAQNEKDQDEYYEQLRFKQRDYYR